MPYSATPPNPAMVRAPSGSRSSVDIADRPERRTGAVRVDTRDLPRQRLDLQPVHGHHGVAVIEEMMGERTAPCS